jgi:hypothetical protein
MRKSPIALLLLALSAGCDRKESTTPEHATYVFRGPPELEGATLSVAGQSVQFEATYADLGHPPYAEARATVSGKGAPTSGAILGATPCGDTTFPLTMKPPAEPNGPIGVEPVAPLPDSITIWVDTSDTDTSLRAGAAVLRRGRNRVFDPQCIPTIAVTSSLEQTRLGTIEVGRLGASSFLVTTRSSTCYAYARFGKSAFDPSIGVDRLSGPHTRIRTILRGAHVYALEDGTRIENFLTPSPLGLEAWPETDAATLHGFVVHELIAVKCPSP